jgi:hypothetical protein
MEGANGSQSKHKTHAHMDLVERHMRCVERHMRCLSLNEMGTKRERVRSVFTMMGLKFHFR